MKSVKEMHTTLKKQTLFNIRMWLGTKALGSCKNLARKTCKSSGYSGGGLSFLLLIHFLYFEYFCWQ